MQPSTLHFEMEIETSVETTNGRAELPIKLSGDYQAPDRSMGTMLINLGFISVRSQVINIGDITYIQDESTGEWSSSTASSPVVAGPSVLLNPDLKTLVSLELLGIESIDGVDAHHFRAIAPAGTLDDSLGQLEMEYWVGLDDGDLIQVLARGAVALRPDSGSLSKMSVTGTADVTVMIKLSELGKPVSITAPENLAPTPDPEAEPVEPGAPPLPLGPKNESTVEPATVVPPSSMLEPTRGTIPSAKF